MRKCVLDATINRNSDKENGTTYPVTPTKELGNDITVKHHVSGIFVKKLNKSI